MCEATFRRLTRLALVLSLISLAACDPGLRGIDRRVDEMIAERQAAMAANGNTTRDFPPEVSEPSTSVYEMDPATENPPASELEMPTFPRDLSEAELADRLAAYYAETDNVLVLSLEDAFRIAMSQGREYLTAQEEYILAAIRLIIERHRWGPRFFDTISGNVDATPGNDGYNTALSIINTLRATQRLPYGGEIEARAVYSATETLRESASNSYRQSTRLVLEADVPLLRGAGMVAREDLIQAERDLVYAARTFERFRRSYFVDIANDYFSLLATVATISNQRERIASLERELEATRAKKESGRSDLSDVDNVERSVLSARDRLISLEESLAFALDRFKIRLNIPMEQQIEIVDLQIRMPTPDLTETEAATQALKYRLDLQNDRDRLDDRRRDIANAANALLPDLNLNASITAPTDDDSNDLSSFALDQVLYRAGLDLSLPLDREIERANLRQATIRLAQSERGYQQQQDEVVLEARRAVRNIDRAQFSIVLQNRNIRITERRLEMLRLRDDTDPQSILDAENDLTDAQNSLAEAIRDLRSGILDYLLTSGTMRVTPAGSFEPLGGMTLETIPEEADADEEQPTDSLDELGSDGDPD
jgi:outer membrane protein TolC